MKTMAPPLKAAVPAASTRATTSTSAVPCGVINLAPSPGPKSCERAKLSSNITGTAPAGSTDSDEPAVSKKDSPAVTS